MRLFFTLLLFCFALAPVRAQNFRVQAAAFAAPVAPAYFKDRGVEGVIGSTDANGIYRYFVGNYATLEAAEAARANPAITLWLDTLLDIDRGYFVRNGLADRRFAPRAAGLALAMQNAAGR